MRLLLSILCATVLPLGGAAASLIVQLDTPLGSMTFQLYAEEKPQTVANFLSYINSGRYDGTFAHRLVPGFILQGGYAGIDGEGDLFGVPTSAPIPNEAGPFPQFSNVFGTLAMAKVDGDPNSATSQWFVNLGNNSANLDSQNGGFTVFGSILSGSNVLQAFNSFTSYTGTPATNVVVNASSVNANFSNLPLQQIDNSGNIYLSDLMYTQWTVVPEPGPTAAAIAALLGLVILAKKRSLRTPAYSRAGRRP